ncbi:hypothetical protein [Roseobacter sp. TSBP12]|uniref:hypothetical protein n=1 Tax=Roseobacter sp. TSBP12 TaxID=1236613 RepID=UPI00125F8501|nr:hypothetical protein [Roseobacter sp. TSBP12]KAB6714672.1 hypothetical protein C8029_18775 [Roseobacter sp. TSBP12]
MSFVRFAHQLFMASMISSAAAAAHAQDSLAETLVPEPRPYPYAILDIQPGAEAMDASSMFGERMMLILVPEQVALRVENGEGRAFALTFDQKLVTQGVGLHTRMGRDPYAEIKATLATEAMGGRVLRIQRTFREPNENLPEPAAILAQLEGLYGPPSQRTSEGATWAWGQDGFIPDLDGQPLHEITTVSQFGSRKTIQYRPCSTGFSADVEYRFRQHRETPIMPGCTAIFTVGFSGGAQLSTVSFSLTDFDLIRQHVAEVDRQILEALTSDAPVPPADMDL